MPGHDTVLPKLRDYQEEGVRWIMVQLMHHKAVLLADDAGLGKTLETLTAAEMVEARRVLIVCPAGARRVWQLEIEKWFPAWSPRVVLVEPGTRLRDVTFHLMGHHPVIFIVGYDEFSTGSAFGLQLQQIPGWDLLVLDEAHYLKNPSNRTKAIYGYKNDGGVQVHARYVILLSGTPTPNHAGELYQHCRTFWPWTLPAGRLDQGAFEDAYTRYRDTKFGRQIVGSRNQKILRNKLRDVILRRRKQDVLPELPPLIVQDMPLVPGTAGLIDDLDFFDSFASSLPDDEDAMLQAANVAALRRKLGLAKVQATIAWVQERMESTEKVLVFGWHLDVIRGLGAGLAEFGPVTVTGETSPRARADAVDRFQTNPGTRVFLGQIQAAGTAITLTAASEVAIVEPSWVPGENVQAICRAHRLGQRDSVLASFLYLPGTLDERIMRTFRRKATEIAQLEGV